MGFFTACLSISILFLCGEPVSAQTQLELTRAAQVEYERRDSELNTVFARILKEYRDDGRFVRKLRLAQRAWIAFRDAHLAAVFPEDNPERTYGSSYAMCRWKLLTKITGARTEELKIWIEGVEEGDACAGSRRVRQ